MERDDFIKAGYTRFEPSSMEDECITDLYQKCFRDEDGNKKYFITVERWDYNPMSDGRDIPIAYDFIVQFVTEDDRTLNVDLFNGWDIETTEDFVKKMFDLGWFKYYEKV